MEQMMDDGKNQLTPSQANTLDQQVFTQTIPKKSSSFKKIAALSIFLILSILIIGSSSAYYILVAKKFAPESMNKTIANQTQQKNLKLTGSTYISPVEIGLTIKKNNDNSVTFSIANPIDYSSGQYRLSYYINNNKEKLVNGKLDLTKTPILKTISIDSCNNSCEYSVVLIVFLTNKTGENFSTSVGTSNIQTPTSPSPISTNQMLKKSQNYAQDLFLKDMSVEFINAIIKFKIAHNALPWDLKSIGGDECNNNKAPYEIPLKNSLFNSCITSLINDGELRPSFRNIIGLDNIVITSASDQGVVACFMPESLKVKIDPNTKYDSHGSTITNPQTACDGFGGTTNCYWCSK